MDRLFRRTAFYPTLLSLTVFAACSTPATTIKRINPIQASGRPPAECRLASVLQNSAAAQGGLRVGDSISTVNGAKPTDASTLSDLIKNAPTDIQVEIQREGVPQSLPVKLKSTWPRLGAMCDLSGWRQRGLSPAGNESVTIYEKSLAWTVSGILDKGYLFMRMRLTNYSDIPSTIHPEDFSAVDATGVSLARLAPRELMKALHGEDGIKILEGQTIEFMGSKYEGARTDAEYLNKESLKTASTTSANPVDGLVFFSEPNSLPITITYSNAETTLEVQFGEPVSAASMSREEILKTLEGMPKGASLRLTLKNNKIYIGRFSSYDAVNERLWLNTPWKGVLRTSSFGVTRITAVERIEGDEGMTAPRPSTFKDLQKP